MTDHAFKVGQLVIIGQNYLVAQRMAPTRSHSKCQWRKVSLDIGSEASMKIMNASPGKRAERPLSSRAHGSGFR